MNSKIKYSVILPVYNEEDCLEGVMNRILTVMSEFSEAFELICVDDGSTDRSWDIVSVFNKKRPLVKGIKFLRNFGHQSAILTIKFE